MDGLNNAFYVVIDKLIELQAFFLSVAWSLGRTCFLIALVSAAINYALTGEGLRSSLVKTGKATAFCMVILLLYPWIIGHITRWTFNQAKNSLADSVESYYTKKTTDMINSTETTPENRDMNDTYGQAATIAVAADDPSKFFTSVNDIIQDRGEGNMTYSVLAPAAVLRTVLIVAGECLSYADKSTALFQESMADGIGRKIKGLVCAFFVIVTGTFAVIEYTLAFLEFIMVTSVGVILFPLAVWEGSKFLSEKFVGAVVGFTIKLLFCNICIFLMFWGFISIANYFYKVPFTGLADEIVRIVFSCLFFFYLCKSAPGLAQSLLTGTPSLTASGAISAAAGGVAAAAGAAKLATPAVHAASKGVLNTARAGGQAMGAMKSVAASGGSAGDVMSAGLGSLASSAGNAMKEGAGGLARSLLGKENTPKEGILQSVKNSYAAGKDKGSAYMANAEAFKKEEAKENQANETAGQRNAAKASAADAATDAERERMKSAVMASPVGGAINKVASSGVIEKAAAAAKAAGLG